MMLLVSEVSAVAAGVFTTNAVPGEPVVVSKKHIRNGRAQAVICNSGIANVCTGEQGHADALQMCQWTADQVGCQAADVLVCSTGVIGHRLPMDHIQRGIATLGPRLRSSQGADAAGAQAILTTDLVIKTAATSFKLGKKTVRIGGVAKGSGMIAPNMATMLGFLTTDLAISPAMLRASLKRAVNVSFNRISVDEDTSTSDSVLVLANGQAGNRTITAKGAALAAFEKALTEVCKSLAYQVVKDGEGATRVFRVDVQNAASQKDADRVGKTIVASPLVKTAVHGGDPNWGRLVMAVGRSGAKVKPEKLDIFIGDIPVCIGGQPVDHNRTTQRKLVDHMQRKEVYLVVDLHLGQAHSQWFGCDLSRQYVTINADYTT